MGSCPASNTMYYGTSAREGQSEMKQKGKRPFGIPTVKTKAGIKETTSKHKAGSRTTGLLGSTRKGCFIFHKPAMNRPKSPLNDH